MKLNKSLRLSNGTVVPRGTVLNFSTEGFANYKGHKVPKVALEGKDDLLPGDRMAIEKGYDKARILELSKYAASIDSTGEGDIDVKKWFDKAKSLFGEAKAKALADIYGVEL